MSWDGFCDSLEKGPVRAGCLIVGLLVFFGAVLGAVGCVAGWFSEAAHVAREEFGPRALLKKYEYFKDVAAALDKKMADVAVYEAKLKNLEQAYAGKPRAEWPRDERETYNQWSTELAGIKAIFNQTAAEYNAAMAKDNWAFCEQGRLPKGATVPLPREYKPYLTK